MADLERKGQKRELNYIWETQQKALGLRKPKGFLLVEVAGFEPASEDIQHNGPTCVVNVLRFASAHAH